MERQEVLNTMDALVNYINDGIVDYLSDNDLETYIDHGDFQGDYELLLAAKKIRNFVRTDDYPWWEHFSDALVDEEDSTHDDMHA